jgi:hypothetical protein
LAVPPHDGVGPHDEHGAAPLPPGLGEEDPKESVPGAKPWAFARARQGGDLLTEGKILERDRSMSSANQSDRSKEHDECRQHD